MSKNLSMPRPQTKSRPDGWLEQSLKIWWRLLELGRDGVKPGVGANALEKLSVIFEHLMPELRKCTPQNSEVVIHKFAP